MTSMVESFPKFKFTDRPGAHGQRPGKLGRSNPSISLSSTRPHSSPWHHGRSYLMPAMPGRTQAGSKNHTYPTALQDAHARLEVGYTVTVEEGTATPLKAQTPCWDRGQELWRGTQTGL